MGCGVSSTQAKYSASAEAAAGGPAAEAPAAKSADPPAVGAATQGASQASTEDGGGAEATPAEELPPDEAGALAWWSIDTDWIRDSSHEIFNAYNFFFEHIGIRKGWRTPPFKKEDVQGPFMASAEVVAVVRHRIDEQGQGMVLRQLEGSSHDWLWGWSAEKPPNQAGFLAEFFHGLVFATLSDANGLVEGLDAATVDYYVQSHPILEGSQAVERLAEEEQGPGSGPSCAPASGPADAAEPAQEHAKAESKNDQVPATSAGEASQPPSSAQDQADASEPGPVVEEAAVDTKTADKPAVPKATLETAQGAGGAPNTVAVAATPAADTATAAPPLMLANGPTGSR